MILASEIRQKYLDFFKSKNHAIIPSAPLVPENDPSVLFNTAGMQPLVPYLLGEKHPLGKRLADVQKCVRTGDIDDVGDDTHCTFFEMLGNWSLGDYFKDESIKMSWEFLTNKDWLALDPDMISVTVFEWDANAPRDEESANIWKSIGMPADRIAYLPAEDNWWAAGPTGPCGPDTEIFYYMGEGKPPAGSNKGTDSKMWMEIWNNVFMQYNRIKKEKIILLDGMHCLFDENFVVNKDVEHGVKSFGSRVIIITNAPKEKMVKISEETGFEVVTYENNPNKTNPEFFEIMLQERWISAEDCIYIDHLKDNLDSAEFAGIRGILYEKPESIIHLSTYFYSLETLPAQCVDTGMGIERCTVTLNKFKSVYETDLFAPVLKKIKGIVEWSSSPKIGEARRGVTTDTPPLAPPNLGGEKWVYNERGARIIADHLRAATHMIADGVVPKNIDQGYILRRLIRRAIREAYKMGYEQPFTTIIADIYIDQFSGIYESVRNNAEKIRTELSAEEARFSKTLKDGVREFEKIVGGFKIAFERSGQKVTQISGGKAFTLFDTYGFPLEMTIELAKEQELTVDIAGFNKAFEEHQEKSRTAAAGKFKWGLADDGVETTALHSACHLMLAGLRQVLGEHVHQAGSNITAERLRFDFTHPEKMTPEQIKAVEDYVNEAINSGLVVTMTNMDKTEAKNSGVEWAFWEKYPDIVKVYAMVGNNGITYSRELCGGPHIENSKEMGHFKIQKEESSSAGVRRIKAVLEK
jgi:HAD superfamily hydrolase (TIGR01509 family)